MRIFRSCLRWAITASCCIWGSCIASDGVSQEDTLENHRDIERWTPARITAMGWPDTNPNGLPPVPHYNLPNGFAFLGRDLKRQPQDTGGTLEAVAPIARGFERYSVDYPRMDLHTLFPVLSKLYCFDQTVEVGGKTFVSAFRLNDAEWPPGTAMGKDSLIFPAVAPGWSKYQGSGSLEGHFEVLVGPIAPEDQGHRLTARIQTCDTEKSGRFEPDDSAHWQTLRVGDNVRFGGGRYYRLIKIVPPNNTGHVVRGHLCKMIGWIELDIKPITEPAEVPPSSKDRPSTFRPQL